MGKHQRKVAAGLKARQDETPVSREKFTYHKPGSQNRKKAWNKAPR